MLTVASDEPLISQQEAGAAVQRGGVFNAVVNLFAEVMGAGLLAPSHTPRSSGVHPCSSGPLMSAPCDTSQRSTAPHACTEGDGR